MADNLPPEHIGNIPAGHKRDEEKRKRADTLAAEIEKDAEAGSLNPDALKIENEVAQHFNEFTGQLDVSNRQAGRYYVWVKCHNTVTAAYKAMGFQPVKGDDPECEEYKGNDCAGASSLRGVADVLLYWCPIDLHERRDRHYEEQAAQKIGTVEEALADDFNYGPHGRKWGPLMHGKQDDPLLKRTVLRGTNGQIERVNEALRTGQPLPAGVQVRG